MKYNAEEKAERAAELFMSGYNCAQSVFAAFAPDFGIDFTTSLRLSASFGGGMGRLRSVCGAVSAMFMVLGLYNGSTDPLNREAKAANYAAVQELAARFKSINGSIVCAELLGLLKEQQGSTGKMSVQAVESPMPSERTKEYYAKRPCVRHIMTCARLLAEYLTEAELLTEQSEESPQAK